MLGTSDLGLIKVIACERVLKILAFDYRKQQVIIIGLSTN